MRNLGLPPWGTTAVVLALISAVVVLAVTYTPIPQAIYYLLAVVIGGHINQSGVSVASSSASKTTTSTSSPASSAAPGTVPAA